MLFCSSVLLVCLLWRCQGCLPPLLALSRLSLPLFPSPLTAFFHYHNVLVSIHPLAPSFTAFVTTAELFSLSLCPRSSPSIPACSPSFFLVILVSNHSHARHAVPPFSTLPYNFPAAPPVLRCQPLAQHPWIARDVSLSSATTQLPILITSPIT